MDHGVEVFRITLDGEDDGPFFDRYSQMARSVEGLDGDGLEAFHVLAAQKHLWDYYTRVALQRGMQGGRNSGRAMTYGEAYQRLFPMVVEELK